MKISFCTTCMGRRHHIEQTLLQNIKDNLPKNPGDPQVEFVLIDYNSKDGLKEWVENNPALKPYLEDGTLVFARYPDAESFHHAHAKNMAHRLATGDVVCNVDADNFTGKGFARYLADVFAEDPHAVVHPSVKTIRDLPPEGTGCFGRIAMQREDFLALGGYSEDRFKKGWGFEDTDLIIRGLAYGLEPRPLFNLDFLKVIPHDHEERVKNSAGGVTVKDVEKTRSLARQVRLTFRTLASSVQANQGLFGMGRILKIDNKEKVIGALESFARVSRQNIHAIVPMIRDHATRSPEKRRAARRPPV